MLITLYLVFFLVSFALFIYSMNTDRVDVPVFATCFLFAAGVLAFSIQTSSVMPNLATYAYDSGSVSTINYTYSNALFLADKDTTIPYAAICFVSALYSVYIVVTNVLKLKNLQED